jgi:hypothetical protein
MRRIVPRRILPQRVFRSPATTSAALKLATGPMRSRTNSMASRAEAAQISAVTRQIGIHPVTAALRGETAELTS